MVGGSYIGFNGEIYSGSYENYRFNYQKEIVCRIFSKKDNIQLDTTNIKNC